MKRKKLRNEYDGATYVCVRAVRNLDTLTGPSATDAFEVLIEFKSMRKSKWVLKSSAMKKMGYGPHLIQLNALEKSGHCLQRPIPLQYREHCTVCISSVLPSGGGLAK